MHILFITPWYPTATHPVAGVFVQRDAELVSTAHHVEVVHLVDPDHLSDADLTDDPGGVRIHRIPMRHSDPLAPIRLWRTLRPLIERSDVIHSHAFHALKPFAFRRVRRPWVHSEHWSGVANPHAFSIPGRLLFALTARLLRRPDVVTAVSSFLLDRVQDHRSGPTMIVPSVVNTVSPRPASHSPGSLRLVTVANLVEGKDPVLAVETVEELHRRGIAAELRWAGDGPLRPVVESRLRAGSGVTLLGALDRTGVGAELDEAEIFLLPTRGETLCLSAIEAISHGRPVVMGDIGGQRDYVSPSNGILVSERTPAAYADAVLRLAESFDVLTAEHVASSISGRFSPARVLELYESAYATAKTHRMKGNH